MKFCYPKTDQVAIEYKEYFQVQDTMKLAENVTVSFCTYLLYGCIYRYLIQSVYYLMDAPSEAKFIELLSRENCLP